MTFALDIPTPLAMVITAWDVALWVGIFASVTLLILAVFSQPGRVQISPQREVALATGHTDRRTVFEQPGLRALMWLLLALSHRLAMPRLKQWLRRKLVAAGSPNYYTPEEYLAVCLMGGLGFGAAAGVLVLVLTGEFSMILPVGAFFLGAGLLLYRIYEQAAARVREIAKRVPYALDLIALAMGAGATFTEAVRTVVREDPEEPFNVELRTLLAEIDLGTTRRAALQNLAGRVPLDMLHSIVASIIQAEELGTPLADVLHSQATLLRMNRSVRAENAAAVASVRILLPGVLIVAAVVLAVFAPFIIRAVRGGLF